jgi:hypothetical protein
MEGGARAISESPFRWLVAVGIILAGAVAYVNTFDGEWVWDDASSVLLHQHVQDPLKFFQLFREDQHAFGQGQGNFYRPLVSASFMLDYLWSYEPGQETGSKASYPDIKPLLFHVTNMLWHIAAALLLFALLTLLDAPRLVRAAVPMIYVLHPLHTEAVAYISGRADMMSAAFMFAGLWFALRAETAARPAPGWVASGACFCGALLSKESAFVYPLLLGLLLFLRPRPETDGENRQAGYARRMAPLAIAVVIMAGYAGLRMTVLKFADAGSGPASPLGQRLVETGQAFAFYIRVLFLPFGLHMEQTLTGTPRWTALVGLLLLLACGAVVAVSLKKGQRRIALGMGWFLITWLPISGVFPLNAPMAEHWMYVPMAGFWWALAEMVWLGCERRPVVRRAALTGAYALGLFFLVLTVQRNQDWHSNERLFRATLAQNPATARVHYNLAVTYEDLLGNLPGARRHYEALLHLYDTQKRREARPGEETRRAILPEEVDVHLSLGRVLRRQGEYLAAVEHLSPVMGLARSEQFRAHSGAAALEMGKCLLALGEAARADACFRQALAIDPGRVEEVEALLAGARLRD